MFKIDKCVRVVKNLPQVTQIRYLSSKDEGCCKVCPPRYYCAQPVDEDEIDIEKLKRENMHPLLKKKCPKDPKTMKNIFLFLCVPAMIVLFFDCFIINKEPHKRPQFIKFTYLRIRKKPFPWDPVRTLFHNPRYNALPDGYEIEVPEDEEIPAFN